MTRLAMSELLPLYYAGIGAHQNVPDKILNQMSDIAFRFSRMDWILRSGGAQQCDLAFETGLGLLGRKEIYLAGDASPRAYEIARTFVRGEWDDRGSYAQDLLARNVHQMLGRDLDRPSRIAVCYTSNGQDKG